MPSRFLNPTTLAFVFGFVGVALRAAHYLRNRSLWHDEACLSLNIVNRSYSELFTSLDFDQVAPIGFLLIQKCLTDLLGPTEYALRLFPFCCGLLSIFFFHRFATAMGGKKAALTGLFFFAVMSRPIYYAAEAKQYSSDIAGSCLLYALAAPLLTSWQGRRLGYLLVTGALIVWISHPAAFILAGIGGALMFRAAYRRRWSELCQLALTSAVWLASFTFSLSLVSVTESEVVAFMRQNWHNLGAFVTFDSVAAFEWLFDSFFAFFETSIGFKMQGLAAFAFLVGAFLLGRESRTWFALLFLPIGVTLAVSAAQWYPFQGRHLVFLAPGCLAITLFGAERIRQSTHRQYRVVGIILLVLLALRPTLGAFKKALNSHERQSNRAVLEYIQDRAQADDRLFVFFHARPTFEFYRDRYGLDARESVFEEVPRNWSELEQLVGTGRVWIIGTDISFRKGKSQESLFSYLDGVGRRLDSIVATRAFGYLYEFEALDHLAPR